ncbi:MAG: hypothetical protein LUQ25_03955 [Methanoregulaceae archaeon]|nr:hypothetical protein [Methanoregulaceae archaeon]
MKTESRIRTLTGLIILMATVLVFVTTASASDTEDSALLAPFMPQSAGLSTSVAPVPAGGITFSQDENLIANPGLSPFRNTRYETALSQMLRGDEATAPMDGFAYGDVTAFARAHLRDGSSHIEYEQTVSASGLIKTFEFSFTYSSAGR